MVEGRSDCRSGGGFSLGCARWKVSAKCERMAAAKRSK
jgi:hypothetical protein